MILKNIEKNEHNNAVFTVASDAGEFEKLLPLKDDDGFLEILSNNSSNADYIWKTDLNINTLGQGL